LPLFTISGTVRGGKVTRKAVIVGVLLPFVGSCQNWWGEGRLKMCGSEWRGVGGVGNGEVGEAMGMMGPQREIWVAVVVGMGRG